MRIENSGQYGSSARVIDLCGILQVLPDSDNLAVGDPDVGLHLANAGDNQRTVADDEIECLCTAGHDYLLSLKTGS